MQKFYLVKKLNLQVITICIVLSLVIQTSDLSTSYYLKVIKLYTGTRVITYNNFTSNNISCHFKHSSNDLPSADDKSFFPPEKSIFFLEPSCSGSVNSRQACAIESAARANPDWQINVLFAGPVNSLFQKGITFANLQLYELRNVKFYRIQSAKYAAGTPLGEFLTKHYLNSIGDFSVYNSSDVLRYLTLYKFGGVYLDLDVIVAKSFDGLSKNWVGRQSHTEMAAGALAMSRDKLGRSVAEASIKKLCRNFRSNIWSGNSVEVITSALKEICTTSEIANMSAATCNDLYVTTRKIVDEPLFERPIGNHSFHIGREAVLGCSIVNLGKHKVGWLRAEDQTVLTMHERAVLGARYSVSLDAPRTWQLRIRPLRAEDRGCYMCQINTQPNMKWQIGCIDVYVPPDITNEETSADVAAHELDNVTLTCTATGHPPPKITWRREDHEPILLKKIGGRDFYKVESYVGSSLPLLRVDRRQMGAFLCIASNDVPPAVSKRITLNVNFLPTVIVPNQLLGAPLGTDVVLECTVEAYPNTINYWLKNRGEMLLDGPKNIITEERSSYKVLMKLTIRNFARSDIGTYNCVSTNSLGKSEGTLRLYEIKLYPSSQSAAEVNVGGLTEGGVKQKTRSCASRIDLRTYSVLIVLNLSITFINVVS